MGSPKTPSSASPFTSQSPSFADFINLIIAKGPGCYLYEKDLKRTYRQIPVDPKDYRFLGYCGKNLFYFDTVLPCGLRSATLACQRTMNAISYIFRSAYHHECVNYIDDFGCAEASHLDASLASQELEDLFSRLALESSPAKDCRPS